MNPTLKQTVLLALIPLFLACETPVDEKEKEKLTTVLTESLKKVGKHLAEQKASQVKKERVLSKALGTLDKTSDDYKAFMRQKHRFVLNPNAMSYNEKPFSLKMSIEEFFEFFGKPSVISDGRYSPRKTYYWKAQGLRVVALESKISSFSIRLKPSKKTSKFSYDLDGHKSIVVLNSILKQKVPMHKFLETTPFTFKDFSFDNFSLGYSMGYVTNKNTIGYTFISDIPYVSKLPSIGHLSSVGEFSPKHSKEVEVIATSIREEE